MATSIAEEWKGYKRAVLSPKASRDQLDDLKKAFYAGAVSVLSTVMQLGEDNEVGGRIPLDVDVLNALMDEAERFAISVADEEFKNQPQMGTEQ